MNTKVFTNKAIPIQLKDSIIYIIGANRIQNDLLAYYLEKETCAKCLVGESIDRIDIKNSEKNNRQWHLGLWDCNEKDLQEILAELRTYRTHKFILTRTALFNVNIDRRIEETCLRHGVRGFFYEGEPLSRFILGIRTICEGKMWISGDVMAKCLLNGLKGDAFPGKGSISLTRRQIEILLYIAQGMSNKEIATKLCISTHTVKTHIYTVFRTIKVSNRRQAAHWQSQNLPHIPHPY
jgi:DNA-binding NarL/FixJ family response regulator